MNTGTHAIIISTIFTTLSGIVVLLRCISRFIVIKKGGIDDTFVILAWLGMVAVTYTIYAQYQHGLGHDITEVHPLDIQKLLKNLWASIIAYGLSSTFLKVSALTQYLRFLFDKWPRLVCYAMIAIFGSGGIAFVLVTIFSCNPVSYSWNKTIPNGKCINLVAWWYSAAAWVIAGDVAVIAIPIYSIKNLTMPPGQKKALLIVFALGGFGCIASVLRLWAIHEAASSTNITKSNAPAAYWSSIETNIGIICICLPPMKALHTAIQSRLSTFLMSASATERLISSESISQPQRSYNASTINSSFSVKNRSMDPWVVPV